MGLFDMFEQSQKEQTDEKETSENKEEISENSEESTEKKEKSVKSRSKTSAGKKKAAKETKKDESGYLYPFQIYSEGHYVNIDSFGFVDGERYTPEQITEVMRNHKVWEFFGNVTYSFMEEDNVLLVNLTQHKKG